MRLNHNQNALHFSRVMLGVMTTLGSCRSEPPGVSGLPENKQQPDYSAKQASQETTADHVGRDTPATMNAIGGQAHPVQAGFTVEHVFPSFRVARLKNN